MSQTTKVPAKASKKHSIEIPLSSQDHAELSRIAEMHNTTPNGILLHFGLRDVINRALGTKGKFDRALGETTWEGQS